MRAAYFSPLPPARSGIADYSEALIESLRPLASLEVFSSAGQPYDAARFDIALYHVGNNGYHDFVYQAALAHPGVVVMHESNLHHLIASLTIRRDDWDGYVRECEYNGGAPARAFAERVRKLEVGPDYEGLPMTRRLLERARGVVVHSHFMEAEMRAAGYRGPVAVIPHGAWIPEGDRNAWRYKLGLDELTPLVGIFGYLKPYKRIAESLRAFRRLVRLVPHARMILVGEPHPEFPVEPMIRTMGLSANVRVLGFAPIQDFVGYLAACDIVLNLRYPTVGESSGTLLRSLGLGKAVMVSEIGSFREFPEDVCLKIPVGAGEEDLIFEYLNLLVSRPEVAQALGARARDYVARECNWAAVARQYAAFLEAVVADTEWAGADTPRAPLGGASPGIADSSDCGNSLTATAPVRTGSRDGEGGMAASDPAVSAGGAVAGPAPDAPAPLVSSANTVPLNEPSTGPAPPAQPATEPALDAYLRGWAVSDAAANYLDTHQTRLVKTLEITPPGGPEDRILEMGAYLQITPALATKLGYGEVRGCYYGPTGRTDHRTVTSAEGETFTCDIDHFDAEKDRFPYADEHFSTVLCGELIEHLFEDPMHLMSEVNRILKPGGHLVLTTPNVAALRGISAILQGYHPGFFHAYIRPAADSGEVDARHNREYTAREIHKLLENSGFAVARLETGEFRDLPHPEFGWVMHLLRRYRLETGLRGDGIYAVGRKTGPVRDRYPEWLYS
jgi:glycosyltransferase involved in cell wall biosynthesis/SAM-dependent methyltransferase